MRHTTRREMMASRLEGRAVPEGVGPLFACRESAIRIMFWITYGLVAILLAALAVKWIGGAA